MRPAPAAKSPVSTPETSTPSSPGGQSAAPIGRPKLNLTKRTVSEADPAASAAAGETKASPFGAARPIDTAAKEKEIAEKRQLAVRVKKEQDDKAKEERHAREAAKGAAKEAAKGAAKEPAKGGAKDPAKPDAPTKSADAQDKNENAPTDTKADSPGVTRSYEILQKARDDDASTENSYVDISANGTAGEDNASSEATTPPATVKDENEGSAKQQKADAPTGDGAGPQNEESGWSTVAAKSKNNRRGGASSARTAAT